MYNATSGQDCATAGLRKEVAQKRAVLQHVLFANVWMVEDDMMERGRSSDACWRCAALWRDGASVHAVQHCASTLLNLLDKAWNLRELALHGVAQ